MNHKAVCRTAPATPGLSNVTLCHYYSLCFLSSGTHFDWGYIWLYISCLVIVRIHYSRVVLYFPVLHCGALPSWFLWYCWWQDPISLCPLIVEDYPQQNRWDYPQQNQERAALGNLQIDTLDPNFYKTTMTTEKTKYISELVRSRYN